MYRNKRFMVISLILTHWIYCLLQWFQVQDINVTVSIAILLTRRQSFRYLNGRFTAAAAGSSGVGQHYVNSGESALNIVSCRMPLTRWSESIHGRLSPVRACLLSKLEGGGLKSVLIHKLILQTRPDLPTLTTPCMETSDRRNRKVFS